MTCKLWIHTQAEDAWTSGILTSSRMEGWGRQQVVPVPTERAEIMRTLPAPRPASRDRVVEMAGRLVP
jgi:hypothetical protein